MADVGFNHFSFSDLWNAIGQISEVSWLFGIAKYIYTRDVIVRNKKDIEEGIVCSIIGASGIYWSTIIGSIIPQLISDAYLKLGVFADLSLPLQLLNIILRLGMALFFIGMGSLMVYISVKQIGCIIKRHYEKPNPN